MAAAGNALAYPLTLAWALRTETSQHAAVVTALAPLATSAVAALVLRQRVARGFWVCALAGCALVVAFSLWWAQQAGLGGGRHPPTPGWRWGCWRPRWAMWPARASRPRWVPSG